MVPYLSCENFYGDWVLVAVQLVNQRTDVWYFMLEGKKPTSAQHHKPILDQ